MDRRRLLRPNGPLPPSVYWMRRAAIALVGIGVLVLVVVLLLRAVPSGSSPAAQRPPAATTPVQTPTTAAPTTTSPGTTTTSTTTTTSAAPSPTALPACLAADLTVTVASAERTYAAGADPEFTASVRTTTPCRSAAPTFVVTSGPERIWGSADCAAAGAATITGAYERSLHWDLKRSAPRCATVFGTTTATAGTYHVVATVAGMTSVPVRFALG